MCAEQSDVESQTQDLGIWQLSNADSCVSVVAGPTVCNTIARKVTRINFFPPNVMFTTVPATLNDIFNYVDLDLPDISKFLSAAPTYTAADGTMISSTQACI